MVSAQKWLELNYNNKSSKIIKNSEDFLEGEELIIDDYPELKEITINRQELGFTSLFSRNKPEKQTGSVRKIVIANCPELTKIIIKKINCQEFILQNVPKLQSLNVSGNKITELDLEGQRELINLNTDGNLISKSLFSFLEKKEAGYSVLTGTRKILLVGRTGSGKSTLANVLVGTNIFEEGKGGLSQTREMKKKEFEIEINSNCFENEKIKFEVIDTIGFGDTDLESKKVLKEIEQTCQEIKEGLSQVFFITRGRFNDPEWKTYQILKEVVFNEDIGNYTTIVRTDFVDFEDEEKCLEETEKMKNESSNFVQLFNECKGKLVFVNNPSTEISGSSSKRASAQIEINQELREASRNKLIKHLVLSFVNYQPKNLKNLNERINNYRTEREKLEQKITDLKEAKQTNEELNEEQSKKLKEKDIKIRELEAKIEQKSGKDWGFS